MGQCDFPNDLHALTRLDVFHLHKDDQLTLAFGFLSRTCNKTKRVPGCARDQFSTTFRKFWLNVGHPLLRNNDFIYFLF
jgi:hypothetical protein